jgi:putative oxidoreductase
LSKDFKPILILRATIRGDIMFKALENAYEFAALPLRIGLAALFLTTGILQVMDTAATTEFMASIGLPSPMVFAIIVMVSQLVGGVFLLLGLLTRLTAIWLALVMTALTIMTYCIHFEAANIMPIAMQSAIIGANICLILSGPGRLSLDEKYFWE